MSQKIIRIGSSQGVTISQGLMSELGLRVGDEVKLSVDKKRGAIEVQPAVDEHIQNLLVDAKRLIREYRSELQHIYDE